MDTKTILVVEDHQDDIDFAQRALSTGSVPVSIVVKRDGIAALEYLSGAGPGAAQDALVVPDLILLDLQLPRLHGLDLLKEIRRFARLRFVPVIILTSSDARADLIASYRYGANSYIRKPGSYREFADAVQRVSEYWLKLNCSPPRP